MGFKKEDIISVIIECDYDLGKFVKNIQEKVGAKTLKIEKAPKTFKKQLEKQIKDKNFKIFIV